MAKTCEKKDLTFLIRFEKDGIQNLDGDKFY